jgi:hypothetical protein
MPSCLEKGSVTMRACVAVTVRRHGTKKKALKHHCLKAFSLFDGRVKGF